MLLLFENLQYQITMQNTEWDEVFFITQFLKGLKPEIRGVVQAQDPTTMDRALSLARIQQQVLEWRKMKNNRTSGSSKQGTTYIKPDNKQSSTSSPHWKERLARDYRKANGLCYYCGEKFDPAHAQVCSKRLGAQVNALALNSLDINLNDEVLAELALEDSLAT